MATVGIILPTYNRPDLIRASIESALAQTYEDFVLLIGDNGGSALTEGVVRSYDDPRIRYILREESLGAQGNWLELIRQADTLLVASLHDDDTWQPDFLEKAVPPLLADPTLGMVFTDFVCIDETGRSLPTHTAWLAAHSGRDTLSSGRFRGDSADGLRMVVIANSPQPAYAAVLRRESVLMTEFPSDIAPIYDLWLSYRMLSRGEGFYYIPEPLTNYRVWGGSLTAAGYATGLDSVFHRIVAENRDAGPVLDEIEVAWAHERFGRGRDLLADPSRREESMRDLRLAAPHLTGTSWVLAEVAGRSSLGWDAARLARAGVRGVRRRVRPGALSSSGLREEHVRPNARADDLRA